VVKNALMCRLRTDNTRNSIISNKFQRLVRLDGAQDRALYFEKAMPYFRRNRIPLLAGCLLGFAASLVEAQSMEREVVVTVVDKDGSPVPGLQPDDFVVREDGAIREVVRVIQDTEPRQIALLVDTSEATQRAYVEFRNAASAFIDEMADQHDVTLISFGGPPRILVPSTRDAERLSDGVGQIFAQPGSAAYLLDAMRETTAGFSKRDPARPVIVVLASEGLDHSHTDSHTVLRELQEGGIAVHTIVLLGQGLTPQPFGVSGFSRLENDPLAQWRMERDRGLNHAPSITGGTRRDLLIGTAATRAMQEVANELRNQYLVIYSRPDALVPPENIEVGLAQDGLTVRQTPVVATQ